MPPGKTATACRAGGLGRGRGGAKDPPKRLGKRSVEGTVCSVAKLAEDLHALRHKASADYRKSYGIGTIWGPSYPITTDYYYYYYYCYYYYYFYFYLYLFLYLYLYLYYF